MEGELMESPLEAPPQNASGGVDGTNAMAAIVGTREGSSACQECGNSAKRDCQFHRCRTCCKSRGFPCQTHVKSTWVPASRRRERLSSESGTPVSSPPLSGRSKRTKTSAANMLINKSLATVVPMMPQPGVNAVQHIATNIPSQMIAVNTQQMDLLVGQGALNNHSHTLTQSQAHLINQANSPLGNKVPLPAEVTAQTLLKSVRVTGVVDGVFEFGYHATVKIGGHIFKGVLYNAGVDQTGVGSVQPVMNDDHSSLVTRGSGPTNMSHLLDASSLFGPQSASLFASDKQHMSHEIYGSSHIGNLGL